MCISIDKLNTEIDSAEGNGKYIVVSMMACIQVNWFHIVFKAKEHKVKIILNIYHGFK